MNQLEKVKLLLNGFGDVREHFRDSMLKDGIDPKTAGWASACITTVLTAAACAGTIAALPALLVGRAVARIKRLRKRGPVLVETDSSNFE